MPWARLSRRSEDCWISRTSWPGQDVLAGALAVIAGDGEKAGSSVLAGREAALCVFSSYSPGLFSLWWRVEQSNRLADPALEHFTSMMMRGGKG